MSGGSLNYFYSELEDHEKDLGDKELNELVHDLAQLFHDREWYLSSDTCQGDWNESRDKFKEKWFTEHGRQERIEQYLAEFADEIRVSFGIGIRYCRNCKHWTPGKTGGYGDCEFAHGYMTHRSDTCDCGKFEEIEKCERRKE